MADTTLTDTKEKMIVKDHDLLIQLTTQMAELIRRFDENIRVEQERNQSFSVEIRTISIDQVRTATELKALRDEQDQLERRIDRLEVKSNIWDTLNSFGLLVSAYIGYIFGNR